VPGVGYFGVSLKFDPRKLEVRKEGYEWIVASGSDVLGRFGAGEFTAREALRVIQDCRFNEHCTAAGVTFFLASGQAPKRVPYSVQGRRFDLDTLRVRQFSDRWAVTESGRHLFDVGDAGEGESLIRLLKHFRFDQMCQVGTSPSASMKFLARTR
jgi:hypothetical protein